jgi:nitroreductase family protein
MSEGLDGKFGIWDIKFPIAENMHYVISYLVK